MTRSHRFGRNCLRSFSFSLFFLQFLFLDGFSPVFVLIVILSKVFHLCDLFLRLLDRFPLLWFVMCFVFGPFLLFNLHTPFTYPLKGKGHC
jgi:predicted membrane metal-binding protein